MTISDKIFALKAVPPFDRLRDSELALIAEASQVRRYGAGEIVCSPEKALLKLHIVVEGAVRHTGGGAGPSVFDLGALLFDTPIGHALEAAPGGAACLLVNKGNFYTMINECPNLVAGFLARDGASEGVLR